MDNTQSIKKILTVFLIGTIIWLMSLLSSLLIPLAMALLFALLFYPLQVLLIKWKVPKSLTVPLILIISLIVFYFIITSVVLTGIDIAREKEYFASQLSLKFDKIFIWLDKVSEGELNATTILQTLRQYMNFENITNLIGTVLGGLGTFSGAFIIFLIYYVILLSGMSNYKKYLNYVVGDKLDKRVLNNFEDIQKKLVYYIKYTSLLNLISTIIFISILYGFGIKYALFWGILNFFLNFIPNFGSLIAIILVSLMGLIQFESFNTLFFLILSLLAGNFIMGSIVGPKVMGNKLSLNTVTVIFGLFFWGYIWGVPGMFLSVPLLVIMKVVFESFPELSAIGRLMGKTTANS